MLNASLRFLVGRRFAQFDLAANSRVSLRRIRGGAGCSLQVGRDSIVGATLSFEDRAASISIGARTFVGRSHLAAKTGIAIGDDVLVSWGVTIIDHDSHSLRFSERQGDVLDWGRGKKDWSHVRTAAVRIESRAWIGFNAMILKGVTIGEGAVVGAGSVVTRDVAPWTVVAGNPARVLRELAEGER